MKTGSKVLLAVGCTAFTIGWISGACSASRYLRKHTTESIDTVFVTRTVDVPVEESSLEFRQAESYAVVPKKDISEGRDSSVALIRKDSVVYRGVENLSGISYVATVTGVQPCITGLSLTIPERRITRTVVKPLSGWSCGAFGNGYYAGRFDAMVGLYAAYTAGPFCLHVDAGALWTDIGLRKAVSPYVGGGVRIELYRKR